MTFLEDSDEDRRLHRTHHDKVMNGVHADPLKSDKTVWSRSVDRITVVTPLSPTAQRKRAEQVAQLANLETRFSFGIYNAAEHLDERNLHLFLYHRRSRIVAFARLERCQHVWRHTWDTNECRAVQTGPIWSLIIIWVLPKHRRLGVGRTLFEQSLWFLDASMECVGFCTDDHGEFTQAGEAFVRSLRPTELLIAK
ncbi:MAG: GNAT family N-acetyltransferase [Phycisphaerales bacterium]|nr:GNAT family N-acetyltransferase [Phycisphaerales bacterium]